MRKHSNTNPQRTIDETHELGLAEEAFERIRPLLLALPADQVQKLTLDLQAVSIVTGRASKLVDRPEVRRRFEELPRTSFDIAKLDLLRDLSLAAWHARSEATADHARHKIAPELLAESQELRDRMMRVLGYHFAGDAKMEAELATIGKSIGFQDLANDLTRLARLYKAKRAALESDARWYRAEDAALAVSCANRIVTHLQERRDDEWADLLARLWTLLFETYEEVRTVGSTLLRDLRLRQKFPSLHTATRVRRHGKDPDEVVEEEDEEIPTPAVPVVPATAPVSAPVTPAPIAPPGTRDG
jgi:hypothetical protein